jgi:orotate phosphoribosyltransferase
LKENPAQGETHRILVVDDVVNTGFSIGLAIEALRAAGGAVSSAATWINRGNVHAEELGVTTVVFLDEVKLPAWPAEECPLCARNVPVNTRYAHGAEFLAANG